MAAAMPRAGTHFGEGDSAFLVHCLSAAGTRTACSGVLRTSLVPRQLFAERESSLVNCLHRFGSNILKLP